MGSLWLPFIVEGRKYEKLHALKDYALCILPNIMNRQVIPFYYTNIWLLANNFY